MRIVILIVHVCVEVDVQALRAKEKMLMRAFSILRSDNVFSLRDPNCTHGVIVLDVYTKESYKKW